MLFLITYMFSFSGDCITHLFISKQLCWIFSFYTVVQKNKTPNYCPYLCQILTDFQNSFTDTLSRKFTIKTSLQIPPHLNGVATLPCEILVYKNGID